MNKKINRRKSDLKKEVLQKKIVTGLKCTALTVWFLIEAVLNFLIFMIGSVRKGVAKVNTYIVERRARKVLSMPRTQASTCSGRRSSVLDKVRRQFLPADELAEQSDWYLGAPDVRLTRVFAVVILLHLIAIAGIIAFKMVDRHSSSIKTEAQVSAAIEIEESAQVDSKTPAEKSPVTPVIADKSVEVRGKGNEEIIAEDEEVKEPVTVVAEKAAPETEEKPTVTKVLFERESGSQLYRDPHLMSASDIFKLIINPAFYEPEAVSGVSDEVKKAKAHHNALLASGEIKWLLTEEQILAIMLRESCDDDELLLIDVNCLGDKKYSSLQKARGVMQISLRAASAVKAFKGFDIKMGDFHGDIALSVMFYQAWVYQYVTNREPDKVFEWASKNWNGGPTGSTDPNHEYYEKAIRYWDGDKRPGVFGDSYSGEPGYYARVLSLPSVIAFHAAKEKEEKEKLLAAAPKSTTSENGAVSVKSTSTDLVSQGLLDRLVSTATAWVIASVWSSQDYLVLQPVSLNSTKDLTAPASSAEVVVEPPSFTAKYTDCYGNPYAITVESKGGETQPSRLFPDSVLERVQMEYAYLDQPPVTTGDAVDGVDESKAVYYGPVLPK